MERINNRYTRDMKQTAIEWLQELELQRDLTLEDYEQAKAMEKEAKLQFANDFAEYVIHGGKMGLTEYYDKNFKSE